MYFKKKLSYYPNPEDILKNLNPSSRRKVESLKFIPKNYYMFDNQGSWLGEIRSDLKVHDYTGYLEQLQKAIKEYKEKSLPSPTLEDYIKSSKETHSLFHPSSFSVHYNSKSVYSIHWIRHGQRFDGSHNLHAEIGKGIDAYHVIQEFRKRLLDGFGLKAYSTPS